MPGVPQIMRFLKNKAYHDSLHYSHFLYAETLPKKRINIEKKT